MHNARNRVVLGGTCDVVMLVGRSVDDGRGRRGDVRVGIAERGEGKRKREREQRQRRDATEFARQQGVVRQV